MAQKHGQLVRGWSTSQSYSNPVELVEAPPEELRVQPWKFRDRVLELWAARPDLIGANKSYPWATVFEGKPI